MITIDSDNGYFRAVLGDELDDGIPVAIYQKHNLREHWKPLIRTTLDAPLHVVRDHVFRLVNQLCPEVSSWPTRWKVLEIIR